MIASRRAHSRALVSDDAFAVRTAMAQRRRHPGDRFGMTQRRVVAGYRAEDAAHGPYAA